MAFKLSNEIGLGTLLTGLGMVIAGAYGYGQFQAFANSEKHLRQTSIIHLESAQKELKQEIVTLDQRTRDLEDRTARNEERFNLILTTMTEMKTEIQAWTRNHNQ